MPLLQESQGVTVSGGTLIDVSGSHHNINVVANENRKREGIKILVGSCLPEAIHDSSARGDLGCHPGTREEYIRNITSWSKGEWNSHSEKRAFLMTGPAGAGKSAIARTCAHIMKASGNLAASFFFYRPNGWNDPNKFLPTLVYQLTTQYPAYREYIDTTILDNRLVLQKSIEIQFQELLVKPLRTLSENGQSVGKDTVIIVDGLDECATVEAQIQIIKLVTTSIHEHTTPFLWAFFSRPEPPITSTFSSDFVANLSWKLPLTLSGNANSDIEAYIRGSFEMIRAKHSIPPDVPWPLEEDIRGLVSRSAGLFVYAVTAVRYVGSGTSGLEERLHSVLQLNVTSTENPFSALDQLYMLAMMQIPEGVLLDTLSLLFLDQGPAKGQFANLSRKPGTYDCQSAFGLSSAAFYAAISNLYSVLEVDKSRRTQLKFYHQSFIEFLWDKTRSHQYFISSPHVLQHCVERLVRTMANMATNTRAVDEDDIPFITMQMFFTTVEELPQELGEDVVWRFAQLNWNYWGHQVHRIYKVNLRRFIQKIPTRWCRKIIRPSRSGLSDIHLQILATINPVKYRANAYILGKGKKRVQLMYGTFAFLRPIP